MYLSGEVLLGGESFSESTEAMLDQIIQITWEQNKTFLLQVFSLVNQKVEDRSMTIHASTKMLLNEIWENTDEFLS